MSTPRRRVSFTRPARKPDASEVSETVSDENAVGVEKRVPPIPPSKEGGRIGGSFPAAGKAGKEKKKAEDVGDLLVRILGLPKDKRKELLARVSLAEASGSGKTRDVDMWSDAVYTALVRVLGGPDAVGVGPLPLRRLLGARSSWSAVEQFMESSRAMGLKVPHRLAVYHMLAGLLVSDARRRARFAGVPMTARFVANAAPNIAAVFDAAFPGYAAAGLAPLVAQRVASNQQQEEEEHDHDHH